MQAASFGSISIVSRSQQLEDHAYRSHKPGKKKKTPHASVSAEKLRNANLHMYGAYLFRNNHHVATPEVESYSISATGITTTPVIRQKSNKDMAQGLICN